MVLDDGTLLKELSLLCVMRYIFIMKLLRHVITKQCMLNIFTAFKIKLRELCQMIVLLSMVLSKLVSLLYMHRIVPLLTR